MKSKIILATIIAFCFLLFSVDTQAQNNLKQAHINPTRVQDAKQAAANLIKAYSQGQSFDLQDVRLVDAYKTAALAQEISDISQSTTSEVTKKINKVWLLEGIQACNRVVTVFNKKGLDSTFEVKDLRIIETLQMAILATDVPELAATTAAVQMTEQELAEVVQASDRVLTEFNKNGKNSSFADEDKEAVRTFQKKVELLQSSK